MCCADFARCDVPALALTGFARQQDVARAIQAGYNGHLAKTLFAADAARQDRRRNVASALAVSGTISGR
jgi:CheY-like chemotaxis protein